MELKYNLSFSELMDFFCETEHQGFSMEEIGEAQERLGVSFPQSYRDYLSRYGKDKVNTHHHQMMEPQKIYSSYELIQEDLADEWVGEYREAVEQGRESEYADDPYFRLWQLPVEYWDTITQDYIILWYENQGVWSAGYRRKDLVDGILNPPVYISTNDDYVTYAKCADDTERFLVEMLREAAYGWKEGEGYTDLAEIKRVLSDAGIDLEQLREPSGNGTCTDEGHLYFYGEREDYVELLVANRTLPEPPKFDPGKYIHISQQEIKPAGKTECGQTRQKYGPRRTAMLPVLMQDLGMHQPKPQNGIALHPMVAWMIQKYFNHEPSTAYDWGRDIARMKTLTLGEYGIMRADKDFIYIYSPSDHFPPAPYYYDLQDWSVIGRMTNLQTLTIQDIYIDDYSFLRTCKNLKRLYLHNTNFSDCRLLQELPNLKEVKLCFCPLEHTEALRELSAKCSIETYNGSQEEDGGDREHANLQFVKALTEAARNAFADLFGQHPEEHFYYCTLVLIDAQGCPVVSAMSEEALEAVVKKYKEEYGYDTPENILREELKWSWADSPYCIYGEPYFAEVKKLTEQRDMADETNDNFIQEYEFRMDSMEKVMAELDREGIFGSGDRRKRIVVAAEVMPPEAENTERVLRLNAREDLQEWLEEAAETEGLE